MTKKNKSAKRNGKDNKAVDIKAPKKALVIDFEESTKPVNTDPITREEIERMRVALAAEVKPSFWQKVKRAFSFKGNK